jgi:hypothetical protein
LISAYKPYFNVVILFMSSASFSFFFAEYKYLAKSVSFWEVNFQ